MLLTSIIKRVLHINCISSSQKNFSLFSSMLQPMMFLQLLFAWKLMPETKGKSLEQIQKDLKIRKLFISNEK